MTNERTCFGQKPSRKAGLSLRQAQSIITCGLSDEGRRDDRRVSLRVGDPVFLDKACPFVRCYSSSLLADPSMLSRPLT